MNDRTKSTPKNKKLRHNEYYGIQTFLDNLYQKATKKNSFKNLMPIIISDENILLATIIKPSVHTLIHATNIETINQFLNKLKLNEEQLGKLNKLRKLVKNEEICM
ncbi:TPA: hypothetical protein ACGXQL_004432 [Bacillus cereus]|jgi:hypothetical protein|uniref:hypothetical protein n=1 Tax=Bacillus TaxID=1386 RepID=UPI000539448F|nr:MULTISPECIES: hypothetical protein [Bacillus]MBG9837013.1 hypothetical protein [Bacillus tropicus]MBG9875134.1 hypothetical protein [Bacillus tropicus]MBG9920289.1 hypothetical protein [Bacillus tropicus]MBJ8352151.1 hypothetical protein [Bacillus mycoides]MCD9104338.1 hypothetical protein [Bacillus sp. PLB03]